MVELLGLLGCVDYIRGQEGLVSVSGYPLDITGEK